MEITNSASVSVIYAQLAQKKTELAIAEKKETEKNTSENFDSINTNEQYDEKDYERVISKFEDKDAEVKAHEQEHASNAPTTTPIQYNYQAGPDGKLYAVGGSVRFDTSIPEDEASANVKLEQLNDAASAPDELSGADAQIARTANLNKLLIQSQNSEEGVS